MFSVVYVAVRFKVFTAFIALSVLGLNLYISIQSYVCELVNLSLVHILTADSPSLQ